MRIEELAEFKKDVKQLLKKYPTLKKDLNVVKRILQAHPGERAPLSFRLDESDVSACIIKLKKLACRSTRGEGANSGLRLIYAWFEQEQKIVLIELYDQKEKDKENRARILKHFKK